MNIIQLIFHEIFRKYRINYTKKEIKISLIILIFIYYIVENKEKYKLNLNSILEKEVLSSLIKTGKEEIIEREIIIPVEHQLKLNNHISKVYRNLKTTKDRELMQEMCEYILHTQGINITKLVEFINLELEKDEIKEGKSINKLIKKIIPQNINNVLDDFAGIGESIFSTIKDKLTYIQLQDINETQCAISTIILVMYQYENFKIINTNTLSYKNKCEFDLIISVPPLIIDTTKLEYCTSFNCDTNKRDSWGGIKTSWDKLNERGQLITLVNTGALTSGKRSDIEMRQELLKRESIKAVIEFPEKMLNGTNIKTSLLILEKCRNKQITFINLDSRQADKYLQKKSLETVEITEEGINEIYKILYENKESTIAIKKNREGILEKLELLPSLYTFKEEKYQYKDLETLIEERNQLAKKIQNLEQNYPYKKLGGKTKWVN